MACSLHECGIACQKPFVHPGSICGRIAVARAKPRRITIPPNRYAPAGRENRRVGRTRRRHPPAAQLSGAAIRYAEPRSMIFSRPVSSGHPQVRVSNAFRLPCTHVAMPVHRYQRACAAMWFPRTVRADPVQAITAAFRLKLMSHSACTTTRCWRSSPNQPDAAAITVFQAAAFREYAETIPRGFRPGSVRCSPRPPAFRSKTRYDRARA